MNGYFCVGPYSISLECRPTRDGYPCEHFLLLTEGGIQKASVVAGDEIYALLQLHGVTDDHFQPYATFRRNNDNEKTQKRPQLRPLRDITFYSI